MPARHTTLITDFDNTLYDWFAMWTNSFSAMLKEIERISGLDRSVLIPEIRSIHQKYHTSEYAFLIEELPSLQRHFPGQDLPQLFDDAIHAYRRARRDSLALYAGVRDTLQRLKAEGVLIVVYTESLAFYTNYRVRRLELDGLIDFIYSPPDHELPEVEDGRRSGQDAGLQKTQHRFVPKGVIKPNPEVLLDIVGEIQRTPSEAVYLGDSLMKDVAMAQDAGVLDVLAAYGAAQHLPGYDLLRKVSHWTQADVDRERRISREDLHPTHTITEFSQILSFF